MSEEKKELIKEVTKRINNLPENKQERVLGIMQGILLVHEETNQQTTTGRCSNRPKEGK